MKLYGLSEPSSLLDPYRDFERLLGSLDRPLFDLARGESFPPLNLAVEENSALLTLEAPGINDSDIDLAIKEDTITVNVKRAEEVEKKEHVFHLRERRKGAFSRTVKLPFRPDAEKTEAKLANGILSIRLPRSAEDAPRKISVKAS